MKPVTFGLRLDESLHDRMNACADKFGVSPAFIARRGIIQFLAQVELTGVISPIPSPAAATEEVSK